MVGGAMVMAVALWHLRRREVGGDAGMYRRATRLGAAVVLVAGLGVGVTGDHQGKGRT
jgi:cytochrome d ubiquinol oxidase subunit I